MNQEELRPFFDCEQYSTEFLRVSKRKSSFDNLEFFNQPVSNKIFIEVEDPDFDNLFSCTKLGRLKFPSQKEEEFIRLVSRFSEQKNESMKSLKSQKKTIKKTRKELTNKKKENTHIEEMLKTKKVLAKSQITKNACCNIVQKAISIIKSGEYQEKLLEICETFKVDIEEFKAFILSEKLKFTGSKALQVFLQVKDVRNETFCSFLKWFLKQKYIRHALKSGEMSNLKAYIEFKNEFILPLL